MNTSRCTYVHVCMLILTAGSTHAATLTVTNLSDAGAGSLRQAILDANANAGQDTIEFSISGTGPHIIAPVTALPTLLDEVTIDGYSQPGSQPNSLPVGSDALIQIQLSGTNVPVNTDALRLEADGCILRGLAIVGFKAQFGSAGYSLFALSSSNVIEGNFIGLLPDGITADGNQNGIHIEGGMGNVIGGTNAASRNVISGNHGRGIELFYGANDNVVAGNYIGTDAGGTLDRGNGFGTLHAGLFIGSASGNLVGGNTPAARNVISGNNGTGVTIAGGDTTNNVVLNNFIGTDANGTQPLGNSSDGVRLSSSASDNQIGSINGGGNIIANNTGDAVSVQSGSGNSIRANSILANGDTLIALGIDLASNGVLANDPGDGDGGANFQQNYPVLTNAVVNPADTHIQGTLNSQADTSYEVDFYSNPAVHTSGYGEGRQWLGSASVLTDGSGDALIDATLPTGADDPFITATATDPDGNTSEFSLALAASTTIPALITTVVNTNDSGPGSLRQAILDLNAWSAFTLDRNVINFNIPGTNIYTFPLLSALPVITRSVFINGYSQPGSAPNSSTNGTNNGVWTLRLDYENAGIDADGLHFVSSSNEVRGLCLVNFSGNGIVLEGGGGSVIAGNLIGVEPLGSMFVGSKPATKSGSLEADLVRARSRAGSEPVDPRGIFLISPVAPSSDNFLGGPDSEDQNILALQRILDRERERRLVQIFGQDSTNNQVIGNLIGDTNGDGTINGADFDFGGSVVVLGDNTSGRVAGNSMNGEIAVSQTASYLIQGNDHVHPLGPLVDKGASGPGSCQHCPSNVSLSQNGDVWTVTATMQNIFPGEIFSVEAHANYGSSTSLGEAWLARGSSQVITASSINPQVSFPMEDPYLTPDDRVALTVTGISGANSTTDETVFFNVLDGTEVAKTDLQITLVTDPSDQVPMGEEITYTLTVTNAGPSDDPDVEVHINAHPSSISTFSPGTGSMDTDMAVFTSFLLARWNVGPLLVGEEAILTYSSGEHVIGPPIVSHASVHGNTVELNPDDNYVSSSIPIGPSLCSPPILSEVSANPVAGNLNLSVITCPHISMVIEGNNSPFTTPIDWQPIAIATSDPDGIANGSIPIDPALGGAWVRAAIPPVTIRQLNLDLDDGMRLNSDWGAADVSLTSSDDLLYANLNRGGSWVIQNIPVPSVQTPHVLQSVRICFPIGSDGVEVNSLPLAFSLTPSPMGGPPTPLVETPVFPDVVRFRSGISDGPATYASATALVGGPATAWLTAPAVFPNREQEFNECAPAAILNSLEYLNGVFALGMTTSDLTLQNMKTATDWEPQEGAPAGTGTEVQWVTRKQEYMATNGLPIITETTTNVVTAMAALTNGYDIEILYTRHVACVVGIATLDDGRYALTVLDDTRQGEPGGTAAREIILDLQTGEITGDPVARQFHKFVIERPDTP